MFLIALLITLVASKEWSLLPAAEPRPYGRRNGALWCINDDLYVYGGKNHHHRDPSIWVYQKDSQRWTHLKEDGPTPGLSGMAYWDDGWLFGGRDDNHTVYDLVWKYGDSKPRQTNIGPSPRYGMLFWYTGKYLYIYGGANSLKERQQDMWKLEMSSLQWTLVGDTNEMGPVDDGSAVYHPKSDTAYLWGKDLWSFNLGTKQWKKITSNGPDSSEDTTMWIDGDMLYLFGGKTESETLGSFWSFSVKTNLWNRIETDTKPSTRWGAAACGNSYLFGGVHEKHPYDDLWTYHSNGIETYERYFLRVTTAISILTFIAVMVFSFILICLVRNKVERI